MATTTEKHDISKALDELGIKRVNKGICTGTRLCGMNDLFMPFLFSALNASFCTDSPGIAKTVRKQSV